MHLKAGGCNPYFAIYYAVDLCYNTGRQIQHCWHCDAEFSLTEQRVVINHDNHSSPSSLASSCAVASLLLPASKMQSPSTPPADSCKSQRAEPQTHTRRDIPVSISAVIDRLLVESFHRRHVRAELNVAAHKTNTNTPEPCD